MSGILSDPFPHAYIISPSDTVNLARNTDALLLCGIAATTATIQIMMVGGETLTLTLSVASLPALGAIVLPLQVQKVFNTGTTGIATIVGLYH